MLKVALLFAILPAVVFGGRIEFHACANGSPVPNWVEIDGCDMSSCSIQNNGEVGLRSELDIAFSSTRLQVDLTAIFLGIPIDYELPEHVQDGCNSMVGGCPVNAGQTRLTDTTFILTAPITGITPTIRMTMTNENNQELMCVETKIFIAA